MNHIRIRPIEDDDRPMVVSLLQKHAGSHLMVSRGKLLDASEQLGFLAEDERGIVGIMTLHFADGQCEVFTLHAFYQREGIGSQLLKQAEAEARVRNITRLWLITTNDNVEAIAFYQIFGWKIAAIHIDAIEQSRKLKPQIPLIGNHGIPIRDEIEFEKQLQ